MSEMISLSPLPKSPLSSVSKMKLSLGRCCHLARAFSGDAGITSREEGHRCPEV